MLMSELQAWNLSVRCFEHRMPLLIKLFQVLCTAVGFIGCVWIFEIIYFCHVTYFSLWKHFSVQINIYQVVKKITVWIFPFIQINVSLINLDKAWKSKCILNILKEEHFKNNNYKWLDQFSSVQSFSRVWLFATPWTSVHQASLSTSNSQSLLKLMSIESVMPSNHLILYCPLLLLLSIFPTIRVFTNESVLRIR